MAGEVARYTPQVLFLQVVKCKGHSSWEGSAVLPLHIMEVAAATFFEEGRGSGNEQPAAFVAGKVGRY